MHQTVTRLESLFTKICLSSQPLEWDENHISFQLMKELRSLFNNRVIRFTNWSKIVSWQSFKNRGKQETTYGDIALLVHIQFSSGETIKGVAVIEAKRSFNSGSFESLKDHLQLSSIVQRVPHAHLLLYNHQLEEWQLKFPDESTWRSHLWISQGSTAVEHLKQLSWKDNQKILRTSFPFSMFLMSRIFWGFDLDFREEVYKDVTEGINRLTNPSFLGVINVHYERQRPIEVLLSDIWESIE